MDAGRRIAFALVATWLAATVAQFYAAGFGIIGGGTMQPHAVLGWLLIPLAVITTAAAIVGGGGRMVALRLTAALLLVALQPALILVIRRLSPPVAAIHAVDGVVIVVLLLSALRGLRRHPAARSATSDG